MASNRIVCYRCASPVTPQGTCGCSDGIDADEESCRIACERLRQGVLI